MTSIDAALGDLKSLHKIVWNSPDEIKRAFGWEIRELLHTVMNLRTFILCVRKLGNDMHLRTDDNNNNSEEGSLGSLLVRIEEAVTRNAQLIHPFCLSLEVGLPDHVLGLIRDFRQDIYSFSFEKEIEEWYMALTYFLQQSISPPTTGDAVITIFCAAKT